MLAWAFRRQCCSSIKRRWFSAQASARSAEDTAEFSVDKELQRCVDVSYPSYMIWGCNTGVGKTLVSAGMAAAVFESKSCEKNLVKNVLYVKPLQTGYPDDSDARFVSERVDRMIGKNERLLISNRTMRVSGAVSRRKRNIGSRDSSSIPDDTFSIEQHVNPQQQLWKSAVQCEEKEALASSLTCKTLWSWSSPVSPHLAAEKEGGCVGDETLVESLRSSLWGFNKNCIEGGGISKIGKNWAFVETAGGVASPAPSGTLQCDLFRPLRLPGVLVGDGRLGGISTTLAAYESLLMRGYETSCVLLQDLGLGNHEQLFKHLDKSVPVFVLPPVPDDSKDDLADWFLNSGKTFARVVSLLEEAYQKRMQRLNEMPRKASELLWWPFTQHSLVPEEKVMVIDSRSGEFFSVYERAQSSIAQKFDACASWWTQGPDAAMQHELSKQIAYAAGRYGHVMFPENVHEPGLRCAELLLQGVGQGWADRVYFSDNGSTAIEIALKMSFRKFAIDHGFLCKSATEKAQFKVIALKGSYHGDTLGAMEAQASSPFTGFLQQPWYSGRGLFLDPPVIFCRGTKWYLRSPDDKNSLPASDVCWDTREGVFSIDRDNSDLAKRYTSAIHDKISNFGDSNTRIAGLIIEPIIHAAGGMELVDPLFQRILVHQCKLHRIPVIFDEVFTGCWRLGVESAWELLGCKPDIACYAKLLTGGTVPLAATLASREVFQSFEGPSKLDALLHGHSYTAHAIGCSAAVTALQWFKDPAKNSNLLPGASRLQEQWDPELVSELSTFSSIDRVISLGSVFAFELKTGSSEDKGYSSLLSKTLVNKLRETENIYARPLGNVIYFMCGPTTKPSTCSSLLRKLFPLLRNRD